MRSRNAINALLIFLFNGINREDKYHLWIFQDYGNYVIYQAKCDFIKSTIKTKKNFFFQTL